MDYEWDERKNLRNIRERSLPFERAKRLDLSVALVEEDVRFLYPERRYVAYGKIDGRLYVLCFTPIKRGIRIISFRKANQREVRAYEQETKTTDE